MMKIASNKIKKEENMWTLKENVNFAMDGQGLNTIAHYTAVDHRLLAKTKFKE